MQRHRLPVIPKRSETLTPARHAEQPAGEARVLIPIWTLVRGLDKELFVNRIIHAATVSVFAAALCAGTFAQDRRYDQNNGRPNGQNNGRPFDQNNGRPNGQYNDRPDQRGPSQQFDNNRYVRHNDWRKGSRLAQSDWNRGDRIDYRQYHLAAPRRGYEWRRVDGNYVMAAVATGLIASLIAASAVR